MADKNEQKLKELRLEDLETVVPHEEKHRTMIGNIMDRLFKLYYDDDDWKDFSKHLEVTYANKQRSMLMSVVDANFRGMDIHEIHNIILTDPKVVHFGGIINNGIMEKCGLGDVEFTVHGVLNIDTFIDLLRGYTIRNRQKYDFDITDAWGEKEIIFIGQNWAIHKEILFSMFDRFRYLLHKS